MKKLSRLFPAVVLGMILFVVVLYWPAQVRADTITVCTSGCDFTRIQDAVDAAVDHDLILVSAGTYTENVVISKTLMIQGASMIETVVDAQDTGRGFTIHAGNQVTMTDLMVTHGRGLVEADGSIRGGGILNEGELMLMRTRLTDNEATGEINLSIGYGGAVYNRCEDGDCARLTIVDSVIDHNHAEYGGGIYSTGRLIIANTVVADNLALAGGGIYNGCHGANCGHFIGDHVFIQQNEGKGGIECEYGEAGGVYNAGVALLGKSAVTDNITDGEFCVSNEEPGKYGGILNTGTMTITETAITGNIAHVGWNTPYYDSMSTGGGIANLNGNLTLNQVVVANNQASVGAGVFQDEGGITALVASNVIANRGDFCVGICNFTGTMTATGITVTTNLANGIRAHFTRFHAEGAGIWNGGELSLWQSSIFANTCLLVGDYPDGLGAGIANFGDLNLMDSAIYQNHIGDGVHSIGFPEVYGAGIYNVDTLKAWNTTVSDNVIRISDPYPSPEPNIDELQGGGLYNMGEAELHNVTLSKNGVEYFDHGSGNIVALPGGGIFSLYLGSASFVNSIVAGNMGSDCDGRVTSGGYNLAGDDSCAFTAIGDLNNTNPMLGPLGYYGGPTLVHPLSMFSPAVDSGNDFHCPTTDQRGILRPQDGNNDGTAVCDRGAYERLPFIPSSWLYLPAVFDS